MTAVEEIGDAAVEARDIAYQSFDRSIDESVRGIALVFVTDDPEEDDATRQISVMPSVAAFDGDVDARRALAMEMIGAALALLAPEQEFAARLREGIEAAISHQANFRGGFN